MIQRPQRLLSCVLGQRTTCRHVSSLLLVALIVIGLPVLSGAQQTCQPDGDVDQNGSVTVADALLAFQQALSLADLSACQQSVADVSPQPGAPDGNITASDAFCIFQKALGLPSCLDILPPPNEPPLANAGPDKIIVEGAVVTLSGAGSDSDGRDCQPYVETDGRHEGIDCRGRPCRRRVHRTRCVNGRDADFPAHRHGRRRRDRQ